jgi:hypothetical protein
MSRRKRCGKPVGKAKNGRNRGFCTKPKGHSRGRPLGRFKTKCGNNTCPNCGTTLTTKTASPKVVTYGSGWCRRCALADSTRRRGGYKPEFFQRPGKPFTFACGCSGALPRTKISSKFAVRYSKAWICRVASILKRIDPTIDYAIIRAMMNNPNCVLCGESLSWKNFATGKTPHLHHDHLTGEIYGFTHPVCNPYAERKEIIRLHKQVAQLQLEIDHLSRRRAA